MYIRRNNFIVQLMVVYRILFNTMILSEPELNQHQYNLIFNGNSGELQMFTRRGIMRVVSHEQHGASKPRQYDFLFPSQRASKMESVPLSRRFSVPMKVLSAKRLPSCSRDRWIQGKIGWTNRYFYPYEIVVSEPCDSFADEYSRSALGNNQMACVVSLSHWLSDQ